VERLRRAAGLASNNAEEAFNRLRLERLESSLADRAAITALALLRRVAGTATRMRFVANQASADGALIDWIAAVKREIDAYLRGATYCANYTAFSRQHLSLAEADAVNQISQLRRLLVEEPDSMGEGAAQAAAS
jgi:hypothetical protein